MQNTQREQKQDQPTARQRDRVTAPQSEQAAQLEAPAEDSLQAGESLNFSAPLRASPMMAFQRKLIGMIDSSPRQVMQQKLADGIHHSPVAVAQREKLESRFGEKRRTGETAALQAKSLTELPLPLGIMAHAQDMGKPALQQKGSPVNVGLGQAQQTAIAGNGAGQFKSNAAQHGNGANSPANFTRFSFVQPAQLMTEEKSIDTKNYGTGYYKYDHDAKGNIDDFGNNRATTKPIGKNPVDSSSHVNLEKVPGDGTGTMLSGKEAEIVGASRSTHFSMADNLNDSGPADRKGTYTWHHLTPQYEMVLVDMAVHAKFGHKGGVSFWK